jgi:hypothetical protein
MSDRATVLPEVRRFAKLPAMNFSERVDAEAIGDAWVGTYRAPDGRVAIVTQESPTRGRAFEAAMRWVKSGAEPDGYVWEESRRYPGRFEVFRQGRLGRKPIPLEPV